ncbi:MAG: sugar transferase [bacterium]|nr:sugar transferase [Candidatus Sumerlaeota bacterium]
MTLILVALDAAAFVGLWLGTYHLRHYLATIGMISKPINPLRHYIAALQIYVPLWLICIWYHGLFDHREKITGLNELSRIIKTFATGLMWSLAFAYLFKQWDIGRFILLLTSSLYFLWLYGSRTFLRAWKLSHIRRGVGVTNVIIIGVGRTARRVMERIVNHPEGGYRLAGFIDPNPRRMRRLRHHEISGFPVLGSANNLVAILQSHPVNEVFLAVPKMPQSEMMNIVINCEDLGVPFKIVSNIFQVITSQVKIDVIDEVPVIRLSNASLPFLHACLKRLMDIAVSAALLALFAIPMLIIAAVIRLDSRGPALFRHIRAGKGGKKFMMFKFRTMRAGSEPYAAAPVDPCDERITRFGRWLRRYSFDEFPQLINVLLGQMSMVGPRPEMLFLVEQYEEWQRRRLDVKPGVTGLWQIVGRKNLPLSLNLEYDFYYIKNQSLYFDLLILIKTIPAVIFGKGAF